MGQIHSIFFKILIKINRNPIACLERLYMDVCFQFNMILFTRGGQDKMATILQTHFLIILIDWNLEYLDSYFKFVPKFSNDNKLALVQKMAWHREMWQAIIWNNDVLFYWCIYALLGLNELTQ